MSILRFYWRVVRVALTHSLERADLLGGVLAVIGGALAFFAPTLSDQVGIGLWLVPLVFFLILVAARLLLAPFWIFREEQAARLDAESEVHTLRASRPLLRFVKARNASTFRASRVVEGSVPSGELLQAWFENRPEVPSGQSVARQIGATLVFRDSSDDSPRFEVHGQWAESTAPNHVGFSGITPTVDLNPGTLYAKLMIAIKYPGDSEAYAYAAESFRSNPDGRNPALRLEAGEYDVAVSLRGINVDQEFRFLLLNAGTTGGLELTTDDQENG